MISWRRKKGWLDLTMIDTLTKTESSFIMPTYLDWTPDDVWRLIKPFLYEDTDGKLKLDLARLSNLQPDGIPTGYTKVVIRDGKEYLPVKGVECSCSNVKGMCQHWRELDRKDDECLLDTLRFPSSWMD